MHAETAQKFENILHIEKIRDRTVSECRRYLFGCFGVLQRNVMSKIKSIDKFGKKKYLKICNFSNNCQKFFPSHVWAVKWLSVRLVN